MATRVAHPIIGREDVLGQIREYLNVPSAREFALILLSGEEGIGKSAVLRTAVAAAREQGFLVLEGRAAAVEIPQPFSLMHEVFNSLVSQRKRETPSTEGAKSLAELGLSRQGERGSRALPMGLLPFGLTAESPEQRESRLLAALSRRESDREEEEQELFDRMADHIEEVAADRRLLISLDDLHNADQASLDFIGYLGRRVRGKGAKMIATVRPDADLPDRVRDLISGMSQEGLVHRLEIRRLNEQESHAFLVTLTRGRALPAETLREWFSASKGNPLALEQLFRISRTTPSFAAGDANSQTSATLLGLGEEERRDLSHAAVLGHRIHFHSLFQMVGGSEERLAEVVDSLIRKGTLKEVGEETYEFSTDDLWTEVYRTMTDRRKRILHKKAALALEGRGGTSPDSPTTYELARHYFLAREGGKAYEYNVRAASLAKQMGDCNAAVVYLDQAVQCARALPVRDKKEEEALLVDMALCLDVVGEVERAIKVLAEVPASPLVDLHMAKLNTHAGKWKEAESLVRESLVSLGGSGEPALVGMAHRMLGGMATYRGQYVESVEHFSQAIPLLSKAGLKAEAARARLLLADSKRYLKTTTPGEVETDYRKGIEELRATGDLSLIAPAVMNYGLWLTEVERVDESLASLEESLSLAEKAHNTRMQGWSLFNMADILLAKGDLGRAQECIARSRQLLERAGDKFGLIQVYLTQARVREARNQELETAEIEILEAFRLASEVGFEPDRLEVLFRQGELLLLKGDWGGAGKRMEELEANDFEQLRPDLKKDILRFREALKR